MGGHLPTRLLPSANIPRVNPHVIQPHKQYRADDLFPYNRSSPRYAW
uniref:Uncharacterized protein n=1 Tax=Setaria viridis TaxID=4556 RepID=A0A4U6U3F2_SETVI|nr:hypothetical protein SEVIR_6G049850v2 [Setaria viridis]